MRLFAGILTRAHLLVYEIEVRMTSGLTEIEHQQMVALLERCCKNLEKPAQLESKKR